VKVNWDMGYKVGPRGWSAGERGGLLRSGLIVGQLVLLLLGFAGWAAGQDNSSVLPPQLRGVGIDQRLNEQVPLDLPFRDETGQTVTLGSYLGKKPVILSLVYYSCPMLCTMAENGLLSTLRDVKFDIGEQFEVVTVSFNPDDKPSMAMAKKGIYAGLYGRPGAKRGWHFLVGDQPAIQALTRAVGFHYNYDPQTQQFYHATAIMVLTPQGRVSRYFYGIQYPQRDVRLALVEASSGKIGNMADAVLLYCCQYDPVTGKYSVIISRVLRLSGLLTVLSLGMLVFVLSRSRRRADV
jgi:protein SCO1/2